MKLSSEQVSGLSKTIEHLKYNNIFFNDILKDVNEKNNDEVVDIYSCMPMITKNMILDNLFNYYDTEFTHHFESKKQLFDTVLCVDDLSQNHDKVLNFGSKTWQVETTSGTTGHPFPIVKNQLEKFIEARYLTTCRKMISGRSSLNNGFLLIHKSDEYLKKIDYRSDNDAFKKVFEHFETKDPTWLFSTVLILRRFTEFLIQNHKFSSRLKLDFIETTSQALYGEDLEMVKSVFDTLFVNNYGCREVWNIAYSCKCGNLHVNTKNLIVDIVDDAGRTISHDDCEGNIVITSLYGRTTPFVKYSVGDRGKLVYTACACGNSSPILHLSEGRERERIIGTKYYGNVVFRKVMRTLNFHHNICDINRIRIIQNDVYQFNVYVEKLLKKDECFETLLRQNFETQIGVYNKYRFRFIYQYPFVDGDKEIVFLNNLL